MNRHLSLLKTDIVEIEKRVFPRFPFGQLIFKSDGDESRYFFIKDISLSGMQLSLLDGDINFKKGDLVSGRIQWKQQFIDVKCNVQWVNANNFGILFQSSITFEDRMRSFLSFEQIVSHIKNISASDLEMEIPNDLKYWLKADGVFELFIWELAKNSLSRFQILLMDSFIEWNEGEGIKTGKMVTQRNLDTPLSKEGEFIFQMDQNIVENKLEMARGVISLLNESLLPIETQKFLLYKLGGAND
jgi:hypothetical protein